MNPYCHSHEIFMPEQNISNSFEGLDQERINWEKKIGFIVLIKKILNNISNDDINNIQITRTDIKKYLESITLDNFTYWIKQVMPDKIIKTITTIHVNFIHRIELEPEYINTINPLKYKLIIEKYNTLSTEDKLIIYDVVINNFMRYKNVMYYDSTNDEIKFNTVENSYYCGNIIAFNKCIEIFFSNSKEINEQSIIDFYNYIDGYEIGKNKAIGYNGHKIEKYVNEIYKKNMENSDSCFDTKTNNITMWEKKYEIIKNINDKEFINSFFMSNIMNDILNTNDKIKFIDEYFLNSERDDICTISKHYKLFNIFCDTLSNKELIDTDKNIKLDIFVSKYYDNLDENSKKKCSNIRLDYNSHWTLFKLNEEKYMEIITYNFPDDNCVFIGYNFNDFSFLSCFNDEVITYLKNKIYVDTNHPHLIKHIQTHTKISNLNNYIDIIYFIQNPPYFLTNYNNTKKIELINKYLKEINYDFSKINYLNMTAKISFEYF